MSGLGSQDTEPPETGPPEINSLTDRSQNSRRSVPWGRVGAIAGGLVAVGTMGGAVWLWWYLHTGLAPEVARQLTMILQRPVVVGDLERSSLTGVRFGPSKIPATAQDSDWAEAQGVEVQFNPFSLLRGRSLALGLTLVDPKIYIEQDKTGEWIGTRLKLPKPGKIDISVKTLRVDDAAVILVPLKSKRLSGKPLEVYGGEGSVQFQDGGRRGQFQGQGHIPQVGVVKLQGEGNTTTRTLTLTARWQDLDLGGVDQWLASSPIDVRGGKTGGDVTVQLSPNRPLNLQGNAQIKAVTLALPKRLGTVTGGQAQLRFKGQQVGVEEFKGQYGSAIVQGKGEVDGSRGWNLAFQVPVVNVPAVFKQLGVKPPVGVRGGVRVDGRVTGSLGQPIVQGRVALDGLPKSVPPLQVAQFPLGTLKAQFALDVSKQVLAVVMERLALRDGSASGSGQGTLQLSGDGGMDGQLQAQTSDVALLLQRLKLALPVRVQGGAIAQLRLGGSLKAPVLSGTVSGGMFEETVPDAVQPTGTGKGRGATRIGNPKTPNGVKPGVVQLGRLALIRAKADIQTTAPQSGLRVTNIQLTPAIGGQVTGQGEIQWRRNQPQTLTFDLQATQIPGDSLARLYDRPSPVTLGPIAAKIRINGPLQNPQITAQWQAPQAFYPAAGTLLIQEGRLGLTQAAVQVGTATVQATGTLENNAWAINLATDRLPLNTLQASLGGSASGQVALKGTLASFQPQDIQANGQVRLTDVPLPQGLPTAPLDATVAWDGRVLRLEQARAGEVSAQGVIGLTWVKGVPSGIGNVDLAVQVQDYPLMNYPVGKRVPLPAPVAVAGQVSGTGRLQGALATSRFEGAIALRDLAINGFSVAPLLQGPIRVHPKEGTQINLTGGGNQLQADLDANFQPQTFRVKRNQAIITGQRQGQDLQLVASGVSLAEINGSAYSAYLPKPLTPLSGTLSSTLTLNLDQKQGIGQVAIAQPRLGDVGGEQLQINDLRFDWGQNQGSASLRFSPITVTLSPDVKPSMKPLIEPLTLRDLEAQLEYGRGTVNFVDGQVWQGETPFRFSGQTTLGAEPKVQGIVEVASVNVQEVLKTLKVQRLNDLWRGLRPPVYGSAEAVRTESVGQPQISLLEQLRQFSEVNAFLVQNQDQQPWVKLPELGDLVGTLGGTLTLEGSLTSGWEGTFDLAGQNWQWADQRRQRSSTPSQSSPELALQADRVIVKGTWNREQISFLPLRIEEGDGAINLSGTVDVVGNKQSGQLRLENVPLPEPVLKRLKLPLSVGGKVDGSVTFAGNRNNPQARGVLTLEEGTLNQTPVQKAQGTFDYREGRLGFGSTVLVQPPQPIRVEGSVPYRLPWVQGKSTDSAIQLKAEVQDEGLAVLNILTGQKNWLGGQGNVQLQLSGSWTQPQVLGTVALNEASFSVPVLPGPLTQVTGTLQFDRDRLMVDQLSGQYNQGQVFVKGRLPLFRPGRGGASTLVVNLEQVELQIKGLYRGQVDGQLQVSGTVMSPSVGGNVALSNGRVFLLSAPQAIGEIIPFVEPPQLADTIFIPPEFQNLQLRLGDRMEIVNPPLLAFTVDGDLVVNGPLSDLRPAGTVQLRRGQVNWFSSQFRLASGFEQQATFRPGQGLDPELNLRLVTTTSEVTRRDPLVTANTSEISEPLNLTPGTEGIQTVRIEARVQGPASELSDRLELSSSPPRTETELVGLLGGGFLESLERGDPTLAIANLAGSTLLGSVQDVVARTFGLSEFRLFPTTVVSEEGETPDLSSLGLGVEAGVDLSKRFSVSIRDIINATQRTQFNVRYRVNDQILLRTSSDFAGDSRGSFEFETRF